jgi:hypothetical protein
MPGSDVMKIKVGEIHEHEEADDLYGSAVNSNHTV